MALVSNFWLWTLGQLLIKDVKQITSFELQKQSLMAVDLLNPKLSHQVTFQFSGADGV